MSCFLWHDWGKWEQYTWYGKVKFHWQKEWTPCVEYRQKRKCKVCGKMQEEEIR